MNKQLFHGALLALATTFASSLVPASGAPQGSQVEFPQASPKSSFKDRVGLTDVSVEYSRPSARGRKIYGGLVPYGEVWRTGANEATKVTFSTEVAFGSEVVPAGSYALFTIPGEREWTVILNKAVGQWGAYAYDAKNDVVRVKATPSTLAAPVETLTIALSGFVGETAQLSIDWENTHVAVKVEVDVVNILVPRIEAAMAAEGKKPYFEAAMFYYSHDLDLKKAAAWMDEALKEQPDAMWLVYRKGLILAKSGDKPGAQACAQRSLEMAKQAGGALGTEYAHLSQELLDRMK